MASKNISTKRKKKIWYGLYAPEALNSAFLGETFVYSPEDMIGKTISLNLSMVLNDMKKQNIITSFRVKETKENKGLTELVGYSLSLAYIKRLVRRRRDKIDDSFLVKAKDGKVLRIKTVVMTNSRTYASANSAIRLSLRAKIKKTLKEMTFEEFVNGLINIRLQKDWKSSLNKIYPVKFLEVRYAGLEVLKKTLKEEHEQDLTELKSDEDEDEDDVFDEELSQDEGDESQDVEESESGEELLEEESNSEDVVDESKKEGSNENASVEEDSVSDSKK
ncbi:MAG: hypothetical protein ACOC2U_02935 [bacterium]